MPRLHRSGTESASARSSTAASDGHRIEWEVASLRIRRFEYRLGCLGRWSCSPDRADPGPCNLKADPVSDAAVTRCLILETAFPIGMVGSDGRGEGCVPFTYQFGVGFEMELDSIAGAADPKRLIGCHVVAREPNRPCRQRESIVMPLEDRKLGRQAAKYRVPGGCIR